MKYEKKNPIHHNLKIINRPFSGDIVPCKIASLSKKNGARNRIILDMNYLKNFTSIKKTIRKCSSSENNLKKKKVKLKIFEDFSNNSQGKTPFDLLVEKEERAYDYKLTKKCQIKKFWKLFIKKF